MAGGEDAWCGWIGRSPKWGICVVRLVVRLWANPAACPLAIQTPHPRSSYSPPNKMPWRPLSGAATRHPTTEPDPSIPSNHPSRRPILGGWASPDLAGWGRPRAVLPADQPSPQGWPTAALTCQASLPRCLLLPADQPSLAALLHGSQRHWFQPGVPSIAALRLGWPEGATPESCSVQQWTTPI